MKTALIVAAIILAWSEVQAELRVTLGTLLSGEETCMPDQEAIGRAIVMVARGWEYWPVQTRTFTNGFREAQR